MPDKNELFYTKKSTYDTITEDEAARAEAYCDEYKLFLDNAKTEREAVAQAIRLASARGFAPYARGMELKSGSKIYTESGGKALILAVVGKSPLSNGVNIAAAHVDSPRLDLKQVPLYEDGDLAFFKTHYYGGIKKYHWVAQPLALHGTVIKKDGQAVDIVIGEDKGDPVLMITDLLPHLGKDQEKKTLGDVFSGEDLNILIGSRPDGEEKDKDRVKLAVMKILNEKYGIVEEDFLSAELEAVPLMRARDFGLDRSMIAAYGHDDRSSAFAALRAIFDLDVPETTAVCVLADKEEIGSDGVSGLQSALFDDFMDELCGASATRLRDCYRASFCLSADVCNAFDPNFPDVSEKLNSAKLGCGVGVMKYTGSRGKVGSNDASAEVVAMLRAVFAKSGVAWQMAELGKVDQGGGGTVAKYMSNRNIATIDAGVPVLSMHSPYEIVSKLDCYMLYKGILAVLTSTRQEGNSWI
ncbi:MAG: aminopeptidase [Oscillospiraceae bacterium]|jgi:aspartyl aminopeptidase|nr:aminopeptidase [Oscillospiraceae bacterium]